MKGRRLVVLLIFSVLMMLHGCGGGDGKSSASPAAPTDAPTATTGSNGATTDIPTPAPPAVPTPSPPVAVLAAYSTSVTPVLSKSVVATVGGNIAVTGGGSLVDGVVLSVPAGSLKKDTAITVGQVNNPPVLPVGLNFVGVPADFGPDGTTFASPATIKIPFSDKTLQQAGVLSKTALKLYSFDKVAGVWSEARIVSIDTTNNFVTGEVLHFSFYALVGLSGMPPKDLGHPQFGDMLFTLSKPFPVKTAGWLPGHDGIYVEERILQNKEHASPDAIRCGKYNVIESDWEGGVWRAYYKIPNTVQSCEVETLFSGDATFMGAREPKDFAVTFEQRLKIVEFAESKVGKSYAKAQTIGEIVGLFAYTGVNLGLLDGRFVKGPDSFNCVGLVEAAYEYAGVNGGKGLVADDDMSLLTPAWQYSFTKPAGGINTGPVIDWASLTPNYGTASTYVLAQISITHPYGISYIDSVTYVTDDGYVNPNININDKGTGGDLKAGDGIFGFKNRAGGDPSKGSAGITFTVTDKDGKSSSQRVVYRYVTTAVPGTYSETTPKAVSKSLESSDGWMR